MMGRLGAVSKTFALVFLFQIQLIAHAEPFVSDWTYAEEYEISKREGQLADKPRKAANCYFSSAVYSIQMKNKSLAEHAKIGEQVSHEFREYFAELTGDPDVLRLIYFRSMRLYNEGSITWEQVLASATDCGGQMDRMKGSLPLD